MIYPSLFDRIVAQIEIDEFTHCWTWVGPTRRHGGGHRPAITMRPPGPDRKVAPKRYNAARVMCELIHGPAPIEPLHEASHLCECNWLCVSPDHLLWETKVENIARRNARLHNERILDLNYPGFKPGTIEAPF